MGRNIEIKARAHDFEYQQAKVQEITAHASQYISQRDTFFAVKHGRLKLREFADGTGELIYYQRDDASGPRQSDYSISKTSSPKTLKEIVAQVLPVVGQVIKQRWLYLVGQTRIHFDRVENLGEFIELEVVLEKQQRPSEGEHIAAEWMKKIEIAPEDLLGEAYVDLLNRKSF